MFHFRRHIEKTTSALLFCQGVIAWSPPSPSWTLRHIQSEFSSFGKWITGLIYRCCNRSTVDHHQPIFSDQRRAGSLTKSRSVGPIRHKAGQFDAWLTFLSVPFVFTFKSHALCYIFSLCVWGFVVHRSCDRVHCCVVMQQSTGTLKVCMCLIVWVPMKYLEL